LAVVINSIQFTKTGYVSLDWAKDYLRRTGWFYEGITNVSQGGGRIRRSYRYRSPEGLVCYFTTMGIRVEATANYYRTTAHEIMPAWAKF
jgi:hypothetical protein